MSLALLILSHRSGVAQETAGRFADRIDLTAVEMLIDVRDRLGRVPRDLVPSDFEVFEGGVQQPVISVEPILPRGWGSLLPKSEEEAGSEAAAVERSPLVRVLIYFDRALSGRSTVRKAATELARQVDQLVRLGPVDLVIADPSPAALLQSERNPLTLASALQGVARGKSSGRDNQLVFMRRRLLAEADVDNRWSLLGTDTENYLADATRWSARVRMAAKEETTLLNRQKSALESWIARYSGRGASALILVSDGFDTNPAEFYLPILASRSQVDDFVARLQGDFLSLRRGPIVEELGRSLAAQRWQVYSLALGGVQGLPTITAAESGSARQRAFLQGDPSISLPTLMFQDPLAPLFTYSQETGGGVVTNSGEVEAALDQLGQRLRLTYQAARSRDTQVRRVEVKSRRPNLEVTAARWTADSPPESIARLRAESMLGGAVGGGDFRVDATLTLAFAGTESPGSGDLAARFSFSEFDFMFAEQPAVSLRITVAVLIPQRRIVFRQRNLPDLPLPESLDWRYAMRLDLPTTIERAAIVIEELDSGIWGGAVADLEQESDASGRQ